MAKKDEITLQDIEQMKRDQQRILHIPFRLLTAKEKRVRRALEEDLGIIPLSDDEK